MIQSGQIAISTYRADLSRTQAQNLPGRFTFALFRGDYGDLERCLTRIDVLGDRTGCVEVWTNHEVPSTGGSQALLSHRCWMDDRCSERTGYPGPADVTEN
jgi:hypothetical protein